MSAKPKKSKKSDRLRKVLIILSNRLNRLQKPRFMVVECDDLGGIHSEKPVRSEPAEAVFDEVWGKRRRENGLCLLPQVQPEIRTQAAEKGLRLPACCSVLGQAKRGVSL